MCLKKHTNYVVQREILQHARNISSGLHLNVKSWFLYKNILRKLLKVLNSDIYLAYQSGLIRYIYNMTLNIFDTPKNLSLLKFVTINKITIPPMKG